jgi:hypothetical protein
MAEPRLRDLLSGWTCGTVREARRGPVRLDPEERRLLLRIARGEEGESAPGERVRALSWLGRLDGAQGEAVSTLLAVVSSDAPIEARVQAVRTLSRMKDPAVEPALRRLSQAAGGHPAITLAAARALASRSPGKP